jgi:hypothetical protein
VDRDGLGGLDGGPAAFPHQRRQHRARVGAGLVPLLGSKPIKRAPLLLLGRIRTLATLSGLSETGQKRTFLEGLGTTDGAAPVEALQQTITLQLPSFDQLEARRMILSSISWRRSRYSSKARSGSDIASAGVNHRSSECSSSRILGSPPSHAVMAYM